MTPEVSFSPIFLWSIKKKWGLEWFQRDTKLDSKSTQNSRVVFQYPNTKRLFLPRMTRVCWNVKAQFCLKSKYQNIHKNSEKKKSWKRPKYVILDIKLYHLEVFPLPGESELQLGCFIFYCELWPQFHQKSKPRGFMAKEFRPDHNWTIRHMNHNAHEVLQRLGLTPIHIEGT